MSSPYKGNVPAFCPALDCQAPAAYGTAPLVVNYGAVRGFGDVPGNLGQFPATQWSAGHCIPAGPFLAPLPPGCTGMTNTQWLPVQNFQPLQLCLLNGQAFNNYAQGTCSSPTACGLGMPSPVMQHLQQHGQPFSHNQLLSPMQQQSPYNLVPNQPVIPALYQHRHVANQSGDIQGVQPSLSSTCPTALGHTLPIPRQGLCTDACASIDGDVLPGSRCTSGGHYNGDSAARVVFPISAEVEHPCSAVPQTDDMQEDVTARSNSEPTMEKFLSDFEDLVHGHQEHLRDIRSSHSETERSQRIRFGHNEIRFLEEECHGCTVMAKPATATNDVPMNKQRKMQMRKFDTVPDLSTEKPLRSILRGSSRHASQEVKSHALFDVLEDGKDVGQLNTAEANTGSQGTAGSEPVEPKDLQSGRRRKPNIDFLAQQMMRRREAAIQARKARGDTNQKLITSAPDFSALIFDSIAAPGGNQRTATGDSKPASRQRWSSTGDDGRGSHGMSIAELNDLIRDATSAGYGVQEVLEQQSSFFKTELSLLQRMGSLF